MDMACVVESIIDSVYRAQKKKQIMNSHSLCLLNKDIQETMFTC